MCAKKYHTPQEFKRKDKAGPVRVCLGCRDQALIRRQKVEETPVLRPHQIISVQHGKVHVHPPQWVPENAYNHCFECRESTGAHPFFCRLCGEMFCTKCSVKLEVPNAFRKKRNKSGPVRVCIECRYKVYAKVELDETPLSKLKELEQNQRLEDFQMSYDNEGGRPQALAGSMAQFAQRIPNSPLLSSELANRISAPPKSLQVYQRHLSPHDMTQYNDQFLAQIEVPGDSNLVEIHERVMKSCSTLRSRIFYYICRNKPVSTEHWDMFSMKYFPQVVVVEGAPPGESPDEYARAFRSGHQRAQSTQNHQQMPVGDSGPPSQNFPRQQSMNGRVSNPSPDTSGSPSFSHPRQMQQQHQPGSNRPTRTQTAIGPPTSISRRSAASNSSMPTSSVQRSNTIGGGPTGRGPAGPPSGRVSLSSGPGSAPGTPEVAKRKRQPKYADAIWVKSEFDYEAQTDTNMTILSGQTLACFAHDPKEQWWFGESLNEEKKGWFPAAYVTECEAPAEDDDGMPTAGAPHPSAGGPPAPPHGATAAGPPQPPPGATGARGPPAPPMAAGGPPPPPAAAGVPAAAAAPSQYGGGYPPQGRQPAQGGGYPPQAGRPPQNGFPPQQTQAGRPSQSGFPPQQSRLPPQGYTPQPAGGYQSGPPQWQQQQAQQAPPPVPSATGPPPPPGAMGGPSLW